MKQGFHLREKSCIISRAGKYDSVTAECFRYQIGRICYRNIINLHILLPCICQSACQNISCILRISINGGIHNHNIMIFRCISAPFLIFVNKPSKILSPNRTMKWADHGDIKCKGLFQGTLNRSAVFSNNIYQISSSVIQPLFFKVYFICKHISIQRSKSTKSICAKKHFVICIVCNHCLWPVNHGDHGKRKGMFTCTDGISLFDHNCMGIHVKGKELFHHVKGLGISHNLHFRESSYHLFHNCTMIWFHMVYDHIIQRSVSKNMLQIFKKLSAHRLVNCIQKHGLLIQDHIRVVGNSSWNRVNIFKKGKSSVTCTDPV